MRAAREAAEGTIFLELDRGTGRRGRRYREAEEHLVALTGAEDALVVTNNAAALALAVGLAGRGGVAVSRGELVEIGGGVRIPDIVRRAGARLVEVGTTNRTRAADFREVLADGRARVVLRVHPSNFRQEGFTEAPDARELADAAHAHGAILVDDLGSGALLDTAAFGLAHEPTPGERLADGADLVTFSGDKLVGGPQAGFVVGRADLVAKLRKDPLARAMRPDKVILAAVAATLALYRAGVATARSRCGGSSRRRWTGWTRVPQRSPPRSRPRASPRSDPRSAAGRCPARRSRRGRWRSRSRRRTGCSRGCGRGRRQSSGGSRTGSCSWTCGRSNRRTTWRWPRRLRRRSHPRADGVAERERPVPSVVVGTAGHIDHGKTTLLRALTGIDADRLPEERRRGMTIDVGYAHLELPDGRVMDFVDVPGHDRLVGNMLVGAGEIDAALLVVAADDGPNAQTLEHLELLDALGIGDGLVVVTKADLAPDADRRDALVAEVGALLARTSLAGSPVLVASAQTGEGIEALRVALAALVDRAPARARTADGARLAVDRVFTVKGRGTVVTGSLRGGPIATGATLRLLPGGVDARVREVQVRGTAVEAAAGGRTALLLGGVDASAVARGGVLSADPAVVATSRVLVAMRGPAGLGRRGGDGAPIDGDRLRLHVGTDQVDALVVRGPREAIDLADGASLAILRLARPDRGRGGDRFALRHPSPGSTAGGGVVLDAVAAARRVAAPDDR